LDIDAAAKDKVVTLGEPALPARLAALAGESLS